MTIVFLIAFCFSLFMNLWHYRYFFFSFVKKISINKTIVRIEDEPNAWYTKSRLLISHAGTYNKGIYMNSRESIFFSISVGIPVIEVDVTLTSDGIPVLSHWFAPDGEIMFTHKPSLAEFLSEALPYGEHTMTLDDLMKVTTEYENHFLIDAKMGEERKIVDWLCSHYTAEQNKKLIFQVHNIPFLKELYKRNIFGFLHYNSDIRTLEYLVPQFKKYGVHTVSVSDWDILDETFLKYLANSGIHTFVYTVNHARRAEWLFSNGATGIFTDRYVQLCKQINKNDLRD